MTFHLSQSFSFDAAHTLHRNVPIAEYVGSRRVHGHTYNAVVTLAGVRGADGMLRALRGKQSVQVDLFYLRKAIEACRVQLDHQMLDEVPDLGPATMENLCVFIANSVGLTFPVYSVEVSRHSGDKCVYFVGEKGTE